MATLVGGTSLQPCDSHGFIGDTRGPWSKDREDKQGFMAPPPHPTPAMTQAPGPAVNPPPPSPGEDFFPSVGKEHCRPQKGDSLMSVCLDGVISLQQFLLA